QQHQGPQYRFKGRNVRRGVLDSSLEYVRRRGLFRKAARRDIPWTPNVRASLAAEWLAGRVPSRSPVLTNRQPYQWTQVGTIDPLDGSAMVLQFRANLPIVLVREVLTSRP